MKKTVFRFLSEYSTLPFEVDRLIISAFLMANEITVKKNDFLKTFVIDEKNTKEFSKPLAKALFF